MVKRCELSPFLIENASDGPCIDLAVTLQRFRPSTRYCIPYTVHRAAAHDPRKGGQCPTQRTFFSRGRQECNSDQKTWFSYKVVCCVWIITYICSCTIRCVTVSRIRSHGLAYCVLLYIRVLPTYRKLGQSSQTGSV